MTMIGHRKGLSESQEVKASSVSFLPETETSQEDKLRFPIVLVELHSQRVQGYSLTWKPWKAALSHMTLQKIRTQKFYFGRKEANLLTQDLHHAVTSLSAELYGKDTILSWNSYSKN